jgi:hypothetical protein
MSVGCEVPNSLQGSAIMTRSSLPFIVRAVVSIALVASAVGCSTKHTITVEPIYMTLNVNVKLDHELEQAFDYQDRIEAEMADATSSAPPPSESTEPGGAS